MGALFLLGVDVVAEILMWLGRTKMLLLLVKVDFHGEGRMGKVFRDKTFVQARP